MTVPVPRWDTPLTNAAGRPSPEWYLYLKTRGEAQTATAEAERPEYKLVGPLSIVVSGLLQNGLASVALKNDQLAPSATSYYGTNNEGTKGWHLIGDALDVTADLTKAVDGTTNVVTFGLADLTDTGVGASLVKITRDAKGRVEGTEAATAADLAYDNTGSGLAATDVQGAIDEVASSSGGGSQPDADDEYYFREDCDRGVINANGTTLSTVQGLPVAYDALSSGGAATMGTPTPTHPGVIRVSTGSSASTAMRLVARHTQFVVGGGIARFTTEVNFPTLSDGTQSFLFLFGLYDGLGTVNNLIDVLYTHSTNSGNFQLRTRSGGVNSTANSAVGPAAGTWVKLELQVNAAATSVSLLVDDSSVATLTTNIPTAALFPAVWLNKTAGTTARFVDVDYMEARITFATGR